MVRAGNGALRVASRVRVEGRAGCGASPGEIGLVVGDSRGGEGRWGE